MNCSACDDEVQESPKSSLVSGSGWCAPSDSIYEFSLSALCNDCRARLLFISALGFDPGRDGENLRVARGGIKYG